IQDHVQLSREAQRDVLRLDVIWEAATVYLNVLRAGKFEQIQRENLRLTRANLERARVRRVIGVASFAEEFRWETGIARGRSASIRANSQRNVAEIALNRVRHRPLEESFSIVEVGLDDPSLLTGDARFFDYFADRASFRVFRNFMSREAVAASPELQGLTAAIEARRRVYSSASNSFWAPTVALQAGLAGRLAEGGAGTTFSPQLPPGTPDLSGLFPQANGLNLSLGLNVSLPIFLGGSRFLERNQRFEEVAQLEAQQASVSERIEQRVRAALHVAGSSYASIGLAREGAEAARNNLELVSDAYSQGLVSIIDLIDAQNAALVTDLDAATAVYDFLVDWVEVERAVGRSSLFMTAEGRNDFFDRLEAFVAVGGGDAAQR
ncbi:MAG: TolC family protein, partial [Gemmatimonadales bacterium]